MKTSFKMAMASAAFLGLIQSTSATEQTTAPEKTPGTTTQEFITCALKEIQNSDVAENNEAMEIVTSVVEDPAITDLTKTDSLHTLLNIMHAQNGTTTGCTLPENNQDQNLIECGTAYLKQKLAGPQLDYLNETLNNEDLSNAEKASTIRTLLRVQAELFDQPPQCGIQSRAAEPN